MKNGHRYLFLFTVFLVASLKGGMPGQDSLGTFLKTHKTKYPFISGNTFRSFAKFVIDVNHDSIDTALIEDGDVIFVWNKLIGYFFEKIHPRIQHKYILITHNGCLSVPGKYASYLNSDKLIVWFGKNATLSHPKLIPIPVGLEGGADIEVLKKVINGTFTKDIFAYLNVSVKKDRGKERSQAAEILSCKNFCYKSNPKPFYDYLCDLARSKFVFSPRGSGLDCYRTWEAMLLDAIPIVKHSAIDSLYEGLPVLLIDDWNAITEEFLQKEYDRIQLQVSRQKFKMEKLYADYWFDLINSFSEQVHNSG